MIELSKCKDRREAQGRTALWRDPGRVPASGDELLPISNRSVAAYVTAYIRTVDPVHSSCSSIKLLTRFANRVCQYDWKYGKYRISYILSVLHPPPICDLCTTR